MGVRGRIAKVGALIALAATMALPAAAVATPLEPEPSPLRIAHVSAHVREVAVEVPLAHGAVTAVLLRDGEEVGRLPIECGEASSTALFEAVSIPASECGLVAHFVDGEGRLISCSETLTVLASDFAPAPPALAMRQRGVLGPTPVLRGTTSSGTATITVLVDGRPRVGVSVSDTATAYAVSARLPYQSSVVSVRAENAWGSTDGVRYRVWNLGRTLARRTQLVVDRSECRLYVIRDGLFVKRYSVAVGTPRTPTPLGEYVITRKAYNRSSRYTGMGAYWMRLERIESGRLRFRGYFIHGTTMSSVIGRPMSLGCVNMRNTDIMGLGPKTAIGTRVLVRE
jgi:hypothetical protein